jgi:hypothetical protein
MLNFVRPRRVSVTVAGFLFAVNGAQADDASRMVLHKDDALLVRGHVQAGVNLIGEQSLFWNLADIFAQSSNYDPDKVWFEGYVKPGISFESRVDPNSTFYGKVSGVWSGTIGIDAYDWGDTGRATLEEAFAGFRTNNPDGVSIDLSAGAQEFKLGTGMLIANGGGSGFERGTLKFGPRKAWELTGIGKATYGGFSATGFYLDANEVPSNDSFTALAGGDIRYDHLDGGFVGVTYANVVNSNSTYPKAIPNNPPEFIEGGREGLNLINAYSRTGKLDGALTNWYFSADLAYEWNDRIDMQAWGGRGQVAYTFADAMWTPRLMYTFQTFSGDDPDTDTLERFDPLFYEGSPSAWSTGSKSSMTFINSNINAHQVALSINPTMQDTITLRYAHIRANELRSPIQFGQATRFEFADSDRDNIVAGVTDPHLSDDIFLEYNRIINRNTFLTAGVAASFPGKGLELAANTDLPVWWGGFVNVVINY